MSEGAVEPQPASETGAPDAASRKRLRVWKPTLAQAGFIMSVTLALISAFYAIRGSVMVVQPPTQLILYRDGNGDQAVLTFAMRIAMINAADGAHGDVLMKAEIVPSGGASFEFAGGVQPVFGSTDDAAGKCPLGSRCIGLPGFTAIEPPEQIFAIPGGSVRGDYLAYPAVEWNCHGSSAECGRFKNFNSGLAAIAGRPLDVVVRLEFYADGRREMRCRTKPVNAAYLARYGWMTLSCTEASVRGGPIL